MIGYILFAAGVVFGAAMANLMLYFRTGSGTLKIDHSNPEKDVMRIEFDGAIKSTTRRFILNVDHNADLSHD